MTRAFFALTLALAFPAEAEAPPVLAVWHANSGSLPPEFAWSTQVTILADGGLTLTHCRGYETEPPGCETREGQATEAALAKILQAVSESGVVTTPPRKLDDPPVGGGATWAFVTVDGQTVELMDFPIEKDRARVRLVLDAIAAAIPADMAPQVD